MAVAYLSEVFGSIQGEGMDAGIATLFLRFAGCNLACSYCDTPHARARSESFPVHSETGTRALANPVDCRELVEIVARDFDGYGLAALTGGEPLLQVAALRSIIPDLKGRGIRTCLETNGTLPEAMREIEGIIDFVSMDIKLPSGQEGRDLSREHKEFLSVIKDRHAAVKVVIPADASDDEVLAALRLVAGTGPDLPVFLQPVFIGEKPEVTGERLLQLQKKASTLLRDVRISVQMHKILGIR